MTSCVPSSIQDKQAWWCTLVSLRTDKANLVGVLLAKTHNTSEFVARAYMEIESIQTVSTTGPEPIVVIESTNQATKHLRRVKRRWVCVSVLVKAVPFVCCFLCGAFTVELVRYHGVLISNNRVENPVSDSMDCTPMLSNMSNLIEEHTSILNKSNVTTHPNSSHPTAERPLEDTRTHLQIHQTSPSPPPQGGGRQGGGMWGHPTPLMGELELHIEERRISCPWVCYQDEDPYHHHKMDVVVDYTASRSESNSVFALEPRQVTVFYPASGKGICICKSTDFYYDAEESPPSPPWIPSYPVDDNKEYVVPIPSQPPQQPHSPPRIPPYPVDDNKEYVVPIPLQTPQQPHSPPRIPLSPVE